jgi:hypothetical protein
MNDTVERTFIPVKPLTRPSEKRGRAEPVKPHGSTPGRNWLRKQAKKRAKR